jgi:hypothetical protein
MSAALATLALVGADLAKMVREYGEDVVFLPIEGGSFPMRASVQLPVIDPLINDALQDGFVVFIPPESFPQEPKQFDRLFIRGRERTIDAAHKTEAGDRNLMWTMRVVG